MSDKLVVVPQVVEDLTGLYLELKRSEFAVRNVAANFVGTYVFLDETEEKDPGPIVESWVGRPRPPARLEDRDALKKAFEEAAKGDRARERSLISRLFRRIF